MYDAVHGRTPLGRAARVFLCACALLFTFACADSGGPGGGDGTDPVQVASVTLSGGTPEVDVGASFRMDATALDADGQELSGRTFTWSSTATDVATVDGSGLVIAVGSGTATIRASTGGRSGSFEMTVREAGVAQVVVSPDTATREVHGGLQMVAVALTASGDTLEERTVTWTTSDSAVVRITDDGVATFVGEGAAQIAAEIEGVADTATLTSLPYSGLMLVMEPDSLQMVQGEAFSLIAYFLPENETQYTEQEMLARMRALVWTTSDSSVAYPEPMPNAEVPNANVWAIGAGEATITATDGLRSATARVVVLDPAELTVESIEITPADAVLGVDSTRQFSATLRSSERIVLTGRAVAWSSSDDEVATVSGTGLVHAHAVGSAWIVAASEGVRDSAEVGVTPGVLDVGAERAAISAGYYGWTCALTWAGEPYCWVGRSDAAIEGDWRVVGPVLVPGGQRFQQLTTGGSFALAIDDGGRTWAWGDNTFGQLGNGTTEQSGWPVVGGPVQVAGGIVFEQITAGWLHSCGLTSSGDAYCWGNNGHGALGIGTADDGVRTSPMPVVGGHKFVMIDAGHVQTIALTPDGYAYAWGRGDTDYTGLVPEPIADSLRFVQVAAGNRMAGLTADGKVYAQGVAWGYEGFEQVPGLPPIEHIEAGGNSIFARAADGTVYMWGTNYFGELGDGTRVQRDQPVVLSDGGNFIAIAAGERHTIALSAAGELYEWGGSWIEPGDTAPPPEALSPLPPPEPSVQLIYHDVHDGDIVAGDSALLGFTVKIANGGFHRSGVTQATVPVTLDVDAPAGVEVEPLESPYPNHARAMLRTTSSTPRGPVTIVVRPSGVAGGEPVEIPFTVTAPPPPPSGGTGNFACPTGSTQLPAGYHCMTFDGVHTAGKYDDPELVGTWVDVDAEVCMVWNSDGTGYGRYRANGSVTQTPTGEWGAMINLDGSRFQNDQYWNVYTETAEPQTQLLTFDSQTGTIVNWGFAKGSCPW